jgi:hypothetical protein
LVPPAAFACVMASRSEPEPLSLAFVTVKSVASAGFDRAMVPASVIASQTTRRRDRTPAAAISPNPFHPTPKPPQPLKDGLRAVIREAYNPQGVTQIAWIAEGLRVYLQSNRIARGSRQYGHNLKVHGRHPTGERHCVHPGDEVGDLLAPPLDAVSYQWHQTMTVILRCPRSCAGLEGWPRVGTCCHPSRLASAYAKATADRSLAPQNRDTSDLSCRG